MKKKKAKATFFLVYPLRDETFPLNVSRLRRMMIFKTVVDETSASREGLALADARTD